MHPGIDVCTPQLNAYPYTRLASPAAAYGHRVPMPSGSYLLECGADPTATNGLGRIPLHVACEHGASHAVTSLLDASTVTSSMVLTAGSSVTDQVTGGVAAVHVRDDEGCTPLHLAVMCRREGQAEEVGARMDAFPLILYIHM